MSPRERQLTTEIFYMDYMSSEESEYEDQEDSITGEKERKLVAYAKRKFLGKGQHQSKAGQSK